MPRATMSFLRPLPFINKAFFLMGFYFLALFSFMPLSSAAATQTQPSLVADHTHVMPGQTFYAGVQMVHTGGWHTYWRNPGDSGQPLKLEWDVPEKLEIGTIQWPTPEIIPTPPLVTYGYSGTKLFPVAIEVPKDWPVGTPLPLRVHATWLECQDICLPAEAALSLQLQTSSTPMVDANWATAFSQTLKEETPQPLMGEGFHAFFAKKTLMLTLPKEAVQTLNLGKTPYFLPYNTGFINNSASQKAEKTANGEIVLTLERHNFHKKEQDSLEGILVLEQEGKPTSYEITFHKTTTPPALNKVQLSSTVKSFITALVFAFIGGLILNLMPCVLPVLALKLTHIMQHAHKSNPLPHGLAFTAGVVLTFWLLAGGLLALQATGHALGWGFQLQNPLFVFGIGVVLLLVALNLAGVFEIGASLTQLGQRDPHAKGLKGSFFTGILATVVATPCTAPFMGTALAFTLGKDALTALSVFTALALGLAAPYLFVTANPKFLKLLPKPGAWMQHLKQFLTFPVLATIVWLLWVLGRQVGINGIALALTGLLFITLAAWIWGKFGQNLTYSHKKRLNIGLFSVLLFSLGAIGTLYTLQQLPLKNSQNTKGYTTVMAKPFTPTLAADLQKAGQASLTVFTADWCITCKVNEALVLNTKTVQKALSTTNTSLIIADWTNQNAEITTALQHYGRAGVPFYLYTPSKKGAAPIPLPELITTGTLLKVLGK